MWLSGFSMYTSASLRRYRSSTPFNFRLILLNALLVSGCVYIIVECVSRYTQSLEDLDRVARLAAAGNAPCGLAVPKTKFLMQALKEISDDAFTEEDEGVYISRVRGAFCGASTVTNALRVALQTTHIPEAPLNLAVNGSGSQPATPSIELNEAVKVYLCKCDTEGCRKNGMYGDFVRRITASYVQSAPAFARYVDSGGSSGSSSGRCTGQFDPWAASVCTSTVSRALIDGELNAAASNSMSILSGGSEPFPSISEMLYRLIGLGVVEYHDRIDSTGACFKNTALQTDALQFCKDMLAPSVVGNGRPVGAVHLNGCVDPAMQTYFVERIGYSDSCEWTQATGSEADRAEIEPEPRKLRRFTRAYATAEPVYAVCSSMLEFGLLDRKRLFGIPDPISKFDWYSENHGNSFTRWLAGIAYYGLFDANVKKVVAEFHTPYLDLKLFIGYRLAATSAWTIAAMTAAGYLLMFASVPIAKLVYIRFVRRNLTDSKTEPIVLKPLGTAEYLALATCALVGLWIIFVDPAAYTPYVYTASCADYKFHGGPFVTTELRPRDGLIGLVMLVLSIGLFIYIFACRRRPRRDVVIPLAPFPIWPIIVLILIVLIAVLILAIRAGNDWWTSQSTDISSSKTKSTSDFEEIVGAAFWTMFFLGGLMGVLNQRHMAANAILEVPRGRAPVFAFIWIGLGLAGAIVAAVFTWPLFSCDYAWETNEFVCGNGNEVNIRWNYFWGCVAWGACVLSIIFVVFASYRVLFAVPRKNDVTALAFGRSRELKANQLALKQTANVTKVAENRFGLTPPPAPGNPFGTGASASSTSSTSAAVVAATFVAVSVSDDESDAFLSPQTVSSNYVV